MVQLITRLSDDTAQSSGIVGCASLSAYSGSRCAFTKKNTIAHHKQGYVCFLTSCEKKRCCWVHLLHSFLHCTCFTRSFTCAVLLTAEVRRALLEQTPAKHNFLGEDPCWVFEGRWLRHGGSFCAQTLLSYRFCPPKVSVTSTRHHLPSLPYPSIPQTF